MRPNALLLILFGTNGNIFLMFAFRFIGNVILSVPLFNSGRRYFCKVLCVFVSTVFCDF